LQELRAKRNPGDQRLEWAREAARMAMDILEGEGILQAINGGTGDRNVRLTALAADRDAWRRWIARWAKKKDVGAALDASA